MSVLSTLLHRDPNENEILREGLGQVYVPDEIKNWFKKLVSLEGVPLSYLIPHSRLLPMESLRFFYVDENWIKAMAGGAFSIGHHSYDKETYQAIDLKEEQAMTGLLLRSVLVSDFPGIRIRGFANDDGTDELPILREEKLLPDTLLILFDGVLKNIALYSPPEGLELRIKDKKLTDDNGVLTKDAFGKLSSQKFIKEHMDSGSYIILNQIT